jgi:protein-tyrosine phosphatase
MSLDYSQGCVNFRDVGEFVNLIASQDLLPPRRLYRGGKLDFVLSAVHIGSPGTILNLRKSEDVFSFNAQTLHFPISNDYEKYETANREVKQWLRKVISVFEDRDLAYPVLVHCTSGKDRTGVVIAALLKILQVPDAIIVEEYLLSDGTVKAEWIMQALQGIGDPVKYFDRVDLHRIRANIKEEA